MAMFPWVIFFRVFERYISHIKDMYVEYISDHNHPMSPFSMYTPVKMYSYNIKPNKI